MAEIVDRVDVDPGPDIGRQVGRAAVWAGLGTLGMRITSLLVTVLMARILMPADFGAFAVALTIHTVVSSLGELGAGAYLIRHGRAADAAAPTAATIAIASSAILALLMYVGAGPLAELFGVPAARQPVRILTLCVLMVGLWAVPGAILTRDFRQDKAQIATLAGLVPGNLVMLYGALHGAGADAFAWGKVVSTLVTGLLITHWAPWRVGFDRRHLRPVLRFGLPLAGTGLVTLVLLNVDFAVIGRSQGPVQLGIYSLAFNVSSWAVTLVNGAVAAVTMPAFARVSEHDGAFRAMFLKVFGLLGGLAFLVSLTVSALSEPLVHVVYGERWVGAIPVIRVLPVFAALSTLAGLTANLLVGRGHPRVPLVVQTIWLLALIPVMSFAVERWSTVGAAWAHVVVICLIVAPCYVYALWRMTPVTPALLMSTVVRPCGASVVAAVAAYACTLMPMPGVLQLLLGGCVAVVIFSVLTWQLTGTLMRPVLHRFGIA